MTAGTLPIEELRQRPAHTPPDARSADGHESTYRELIGFVPPCGDRRDAVALETMLRGMHKQMHFRSSLPSSIDAKAAHLILLAMLPTEHGAAAATQGAAARRAGASWDELRAVVGLAFLLQGPPAANRGEELLSAVAEREYADRVAGAMAAYA